MGRSVFDSLVDLVSGSPWTYVIVLVSVAGSAVFPVLPSESMVTTAGVLAGSGRLSLAMVILVGAVGAFAGDCVAYALGRVFGSRAARWVLRGRRGQRSLHWADRTFGRYGAALVVAGRFIPGGRTAVGLSAGILGYPWPRYAAFAGVGALAWALYGALLGALGGQVFSAQPWKGTLASLGLALAVAGSVELVRRWRQRVRRAT